MESPFAKFQGGIQANDNIASTGRFLGELAYKSFADAGAQMAEGLKAYQKNAAEDDYLTESLSLKATELSKWANVVGQDPKYAPLLEGFLPMMEKAGKGPSMSLNQKRALDSQLGAFLKAVPDDLRTVETIAANKEKQANEDAEASAVLETFGTMIPSLDIQPQRKPFAEQAKRIANEIANATSPQARRAATLKGTMFLKNIGSAMQVQDAEYASRAQAIAGSPEAVSAANYATPTGVSEKGVEGISLVNEQGMPLSPNEALEKFRQKVEELKKANPAYEINPDAETSFLESMAQGIMNSQAPDAVKQDWSSAVNATLLARAVGDSELGKKIGEMFPSLKAAGKEFEDAAGAAKPKGALVKEETPVVSDAIRGLQENLAQRKASWSAEGVPVKEPYSGKYVRNKEEKLSALKEFKGKAASDIIDSLTAEYYASNENGSPADAYVYVAKQLRKEGLIDPSGKTMGADRGGTKESQQKLNDLLSMAEVWMNENAPDMRKDYDRQISGTEEGGFGINGWGVGGGFAGAGATYAGYRWGSDKIGANTPVGMVGTKKFLEQRVARTSKIIKAQSQKNLLLWKDALVNNGTIPAGTADAEALKLARTERAKVVFSKDNFDVNNLKRKHNIVDTDGFLLNNIDSLDNPKVIRRIGAKNIAAFRSEFNAALGSSLGWNELERLRMSKFGRKAFGAIGAITTGASIIEANSPDFKKLIGSNTAIDDYKTLFKKGSNYESILSSLQAEKDTIVKDEASLASRTALVKPPEPKKIPAPTTAAIDNVANAQLYRAASRQEQIDRTADFINRTLGFQYSNAREIAMKFNPPESQAQVVNIGGREFLAQTDPKTGKVDYKELSAKEDPNANYFGEIVAQEVKNPDGSIGYAAGLKPRNMSMMIVGGKYPAWYTPNHKQEFSQKVENANNTLYTIKELKTELQQPTIRLTNRQAAAKVRSLATLVEFYRVKSIGTPPISDTELNKIADSLMTKDANSPVQFDDNFISALTTTEMMVKAEMKSTINTMGWSGNQVIFVDDAKGSNKTDPVAIEASKNKAETRGIVSK